MISLRPIGKIIGVLLCVVGLMMWSCMIVSWLHDSNDNRALFISGLITIGIGAPMALFLKVKKGGIRKREGYLIVVLGWMSMVLAGLLPYLFSGQISSFTDAMFETMSGMTTTGASVINDIEAMPEGILFWRSLTQWIGGMGIIVLTVAIFPLLGIGGIELFGAESPGPKSDKIHPRIRETAKRLWMIYVFLTMVLAAILYSLGMSGFDAVNHALTTMATGGFSTKNASMAHWNNAPMIQYVIILFMFIAGTNFSLIYHLFKGRIKRLFKNEEFLAYFGSISIFCIIFFLWLTRLTDLSYEAAFRTSLFQIVSLVTTTGFVSADYTSWAPILTMFCLCLMFMGGSAGSTAGGVKIIRHLVLIKNSFKEFKRILHPRAIIPLKISGSVVAPRIMTHILVFLQIYLLLFITGALLVCALGLDFFTAVGAVATCLGNIGPGVGEVGPVDNFSALSAPIKWVLSFLMLAGRLELFSVLVLFTPYFWKSN